MVSMLALRKALSPNLLQKLRPAAAVAPTSVRSFNTDALRDYDDGGDAGDRRSSGNYVSRRRGSDYPSFFGGRVIDPFSPPRSLSQIFNLMDQMTENPFLAASRRRDIEVKEDEDALRLRVDMPGLGKEDVNVSIEQNTLVIRGEVEKGSKEEEEEKREMRYSSRIELPAEAYRVDEIKAEMKNGVLRVTVPKVKEEERSKPCGLLDMEEKCIIVSESLPKISASILEEAQLWVTGEDSPQDLGEPPTKVDQDREKETFLMRTNVEGMAMIRFDAMQRANSTLEDFCRSYFMFHGMDVNSPQCVFRFLPVLSFTESYIYQLDIFNEEILHLSLPSACPDRNSEISNDACAWLQGNKWEGDMEVFRTDPLGPLLALLGRLGLLTERIKAELRCGAEYWALERKLCHALNSKKEITVEEVMRAINLKSFDYRVLNLLLYQLREQPVNDTHMEFLSISEFLVEVSDDFGVS